MSEPVEIWISFGILCDGLVELCIVGTYAEGEDTNDTSMLHPSMLKIYYIEVPL